MTDDIVKRLHGLSSRTAYEAADEIDRLRAELAAEREELAFERHNHKEWMKIFVARAAELADAKQHAEDAQGAVQVYCDDFNRVKAELSAERERVAKLREALQRARNLMGPDEIIDAVLTETKGEENDTQ